MSQDNGHERSAAAARFAERAGGERGESGRGARAESASASAPDPELVERPRRRRFTAKYKLEILEQAEACTRPGEVGGLVRREGLYTSHLTYWRQQRRGAGGLYPSRWRSRGNRPRAGAMKEVGRPGGDKPAARRDREIAELRRRA